VPTPVLICLKAADGGLFVALFAVIGEMLEPKRFAGIFGASPAVALANLLVIALAKGDAVARSAAIGMIAGAFALAVACAAAIPAVRRWGAVRGSAFLWACGFSSAGRAPFRRPAARAPSGPAWPPATGFSAAGESQEGLSAAAAGGCSPSTSSQCGKSGPVPSPCVSPSALPYRS
jgi:Protein of unknown function (DUF3147)